MKTIIHGSILGMFAILLCTSCSKKQEQEQPQQQGQEAQKSPAVTYQAKPDPNKVFSVHSKPSEGVRFSFCSDVLIFSGGEKPRRPFEPNDSGNSLA